ncbi:MAG: gamma-glutamyltransferase [Stappiaceae bacterium]
MYSSRLASLCFAAAIATLPLSAWAQSTPIISSKDRFHPVLANSGMVASQEARATEVGVSILEAGGNAVDAAVAVGFALAVTLPRAGNLGGGGFMVIHDAEKKKTVAVDYREMAPAAAFKDMFLDDKGEADSAKSRFSGLAIGVPGTVAGMVKAHAEYGSGNLTLAQLIEPAIKLAEEGIVVSDDLASSLERTQKRLSGDPEAARIFYKADGGLYKVGDTLKQTDLAGSLKQIANVGSDGFYKGAIAEAISAAVKEAGGEMTVADLEGYEVKEREPATGTYRGYEIASMPPPSSGGTHIVQILNILENAPIGFMQQNSADTIHYMAEAMKLAYADRAEHLGDPDFGEIPVKGLTSKEYAKELFNGISPYRAMPASEIGPGDPAPHESNQTTHFSVIDKDGNAVSNTYTLNFSYGVGIVAKGTGILLNNELDDFSAKAGVPNAYGLIGGEANAVAPRKRPLSSMSPTIVFKDGKPYIVTGSPGGSRIISTTLQVIMNVIDHQMNIAEATNAVRIHHQWLPDEIRIEEGLSSDTIKLLTELGHTIEVKNAMGSTQSIMLIDGKLAGASDPRRSGSLAAGY